MLLKVMLDWMHYLQRGGVGRDRTTDIPLHLPGILHTCSTIVPHCETASNSGHNSLTPNPGFHINTSRSHSTYSTHTELGAYSKRCHTQLIETRLNNHFETLMLFRFCKTLFGQITLLILLEKLMFTLQPYQKSGSVRLVLMI